MIIPLDSHDLEDLKAFGINEGEYPAEELLENGPEFVFPSDKEDFKIRIFKENGRHYIELPDDFEPAYKGEYVSFNDGEFVGEPGKVWGIFH